MAKVAKVATANRFMEGVPGAGDPYIQYFNSPELLENIEERVKIFNAIDQFLRDVQPDSHFTLAIEPKLTIEVIIDSTPRIGAQPIYYSCICRLYGRFVIQECLEAPFLEVQSEYNPYADRAINNGMLLVYTELIARMNRPGRTGRVDLINYINENADAIDAGGAVEPPG